MRVLFSHGDAGCAKGGCNRKVKNLYCNGPDLLTGEGAMRMIADFANTGSIVAKMNSQGIAQPGSAPALGAGCRGFKSLYPDQFLVKWRDYRMRP